MNKGNVVGLSSNGKNLLCIVIVNVKGDKLA